MIIRRTTKKSGSAKMLKAKSPTAVTFFHMWNLKLFYIIQL